MVIDHDFIVIIVILFCISCYYCYFVLYFLLSLFFSFIFLLCSSCCVPSWKFSFSDSLDGKSGLWRFNLTQYLTDSQIKAKMEQAQWQLLLLKRKRLNVADAPRHSCSWWPMAVFGFSSVEAKCFSTWCVITLKRPWKVKVTIIEKERQVKKLQRKILQIQSKVKKSMVRIDISYSGYSWFQTIE